MSIKEMKAKRTGFINQATAISEGAQAAGRDITEAESTQINLALAAAEDLSQQITVAEAAQATADATATRLAAAQASLQVVDAPRSTVDTPDASAVPATRTAATATPAWENDPQRGFASQQDFFMAVLGVNRNGEQASDNLASLYRDSDGRPLAVGDDGQNTFADPHGGFLVPEGFMPTLLQVDAPEDPTAGRTTMIPMGVPIVNIPARTDKNHTSSVSGGFQVFRRAEEATIQSSQQTLEKVALQAHGLFGLAYATEELLTDSAISIPALIQAGFNDEFTSKLANERLNGSGVGEFLGVHNSSALVAVAKEGGQTADTIVYKNITAMRARTWRYNNAIWQANIDCLPTLADIVNPNGNHIFLPSLASDVPDTLMGRPIFFTEYNETVGDQGDIGCYNWSQYLEGTYQPMQSAESVHVRFSTHEKAFKFWLRNAGTPWWRSALTPVKGANTLSPFVVLAARA
jgi:HK97 family phage major capsid protein